jgi:dTDP-4-dehydrorhamnose reductase
MRALITGAGGQLARELVSRAPAGVIIRSVSRAECDITDHATVSATVSSFEPDVIINTAAYTAVDLAEDQPDAAFAVNREGAAIVARAARDVGARVIQISTDYVFDGRQSVPYRVDAKPNPLSVYGASKLAGEEAVVKAGANATVVRCGWLYSAAGRNFLTTIFSRLSQSEAIKVVDDHIGVPTSARDAAGFLWWLTQNPQEGALLHWANSGQASWYEFAVAIAEIAVDQRLLAQTAAIEPIPATERPARAKRPSYSVLDATRSWGATGEIASHWREALALTVSEISGANYS